MRIEHIRTISGPNIYHASRPVLVMELHLEELAETESYQVPGFNERLLDILPGLYEHRCGRQRPGGFVERLHEGTYFGHIVEHVALELSTHAGIEATFGKCRYAGAPGCYNVIVEYVAEQGMRHLLRVAVELVEALARGEAFALEERIEEARAIVAETELGPSTRAIVDAAVRRDIPWMRIGDDSLVQLGHGRNRRLIQATITERTSAIGVDIACDKQLTRTMLSQASIPVPRGTVVRTVDAALAAMEEIGAPVVVKPDDGRQGKGVSVNLTTADEVRRAFAIAREHSPGVIVEKFLCGHDYRVAVVKGTMVAAAERMPAHVTGDGTHTIAELIEIVNRDPMRGCGHEKPLTRIVVDAILGAHLEKSGRTFDDVPGEGEIVTLCQAANLSKGGTAVDVTDRVHPSIARMCERAARVVGLDICGIDLVIPDITEPPGHDGGIVEVNAAPGIRMHHFPAGGTARDVGGAIVDMLYPPGSSARIPIISVTGTNGKTTVTKLVGYILSRLGLNVGMTTTGGIYIGEEKIVSGDTTGPRSARSVLCDPSVEAAVLETARGGIARSGLGYDWSDIAVFTNIREDHIGQDGIENIDDLVHIKSLVAERARDGGTLVINADDRTLVEMLAIPRLRADRKTIVYYSLDSDNAIVRAHAASGETAYVVEDGWIVELTAEHRLRIAEVAAIPITMGGAARFHVANCMAAIAACRAQGVPGEFIATWLAGFQGDRHNPGRTNLYKVGEGYVLVDYGHNPEAFRSIAALAKHWAGMKLTGVIAVPGDRADRIVDEAGSVAAHIFQRIIIKEDQDPRGRSRREIALRLYRAIRSTVPERECMIVLDEYEAASRAIQGIEPGEIVVIFYDRLEPIAELLRQCGGVPVARIDETERRMSLVRAGG